MANGVLSSFLAGKGARRAEQQEERQQNLYDLQVQSLEEDRKRQEAQAARRARSELVAGQYLRERAPQKKREFAVELQTRNPELFAKLQEFESAEEAQQASMFANNAATLRGLIGRSPQDEDLAFANWADYSVKGGRNPEMVNQYARMFSRMQPGPQRTQMLETLIEGDLAQGLGAQEYLKTLGTQEKRTTTQKDYEFAVQQGYQGTLQDFILTKNLASAGVAYNPTTRAATPIPGTPAALKAEEREEKKAAAEEAKVKGQETAERASEVVREDIERALNMIEEEGVVPITGFFGQALSQVGGTEARNLDALLTTIKANAGFDRLQQMRDASPTGGALGAISENENRLLQATIGNLEQSQDADELSYNLKRYHNQLMDTVHGEGRGPKRYDLRRDGPTLELPAGETDQLSDDELLELYR